MTGPRGREPVDPIPLYRSLAALRADLELPSTDVLAEVVAAWESVVPAELVAQCRVRGLRARRLIVEATAGVASQLRYLEHAVIEAVSERLETGLVDSLGVVVVARLDGNSDPF